MWLLQQRRFGRLSVTGHSIVPIRDIRDADDDNNNFAPQCIGHPITLATTTLASFAELASHATHIVATCPRCWNVVATIPHIWYTQPCIRARRECRHRQQLAISIRQVLAARLCMHDCAR